MASALENQGLTDEAQLVRIAKVNDGNRARGFSYQAIGLPCRLFVGNGFRPARALWWAALFTVLGAPIFQDAYEAHVLVPVDKTKVSQEFQPIVYSADVLLPIVDLHQESKFEIVGPGSQHARAYLWFQITVGWLIASAFGAAIGSSLKRA